MSTASDMTGTPAEARLEELGCFIVPDLLKIFGHMMPTAWKTLDVPEYTEWVMHKAVRVSHPGATPPSLVIKGDKNEITIRDAFRRKRGSLGVGIIRGIGDHFVGFCQLLW